MPSAPGRFALFSFRFLVETEGSPFFVVRALAKTQGLRSEAARLRLCPPEAMLLKIRPCLFLQIERREHDWLVVYLGRMLVDGGRGLSAPIAVARIKLEGAHTMGATSAGELHASLDTDDGVEAFHKSQCSGLAEKEKSRAVQGEGNGGRSFKTGMGNKRRLCSRRHCFSRFPSVSSLWARLLTWAVGANAPWVVLHPALLLRFLRICLPSGLPCGRRGEFRCRRVRC